MKLTSPAFEHNDDIPPLYTCQGEDIRPPLRIEEVPGGTQSLILIVDDPDAPDPKAPKMVWDHLVMWNLPLHDEIPEDAVPQGAVVGKNSWGRNDYGGPCPPIGKHRYFFKLYALDTSLDLPSTATKKDVEQAMQGHVLASAELIGRYEKQ